MSRREPQLLLLDILTSIDKLKAYSNNHTFLSFQRDSKTVDAVIRNFEIIGEAPNRLPEEFRDKHNKINWFHIRGFRNRIVHDYMGIDLSIVWNIIEHDLDALALGIKTIYDNMKS